MIVFMSCGTSTPHFPRVQSIGILREIMHGGKFEARVNLDTLIKPHLFGLGASDSLHGEILVWNGVPYESEVIDSTLTLGSKDHILATLFVYTEVQSWDTISLSVTEFSESLIQGSASRNGLIPPFPFVILGTPKSVGYHVINFDDTDDPRNHKSGAYQGLIEKQAVKILGFYATDAKGIYTHHDSNIHMHVLADDLQVMGHVDQLSGFLDSFKLLIPKP